MLTTLLEDEQLELPGIGFDRFVRYSELKDYGIPFSRQHLNTLEEQGRFPQRVHLSRAGHRLASERASRLDGEAGPGVTGHAHACRDRGRGRSARPCAAG